MSEVETNIRIFKERYIYQHWNKTWGESAQEFDALIAAVEREALERAAKVCESNGATHVAKLRFMRERKYPDLNGIQVYEYLVQECRILAEAIRALIESKEG